ncbi:MAG: Vitamin B12 transporter BtuB [Bacteroidia bacterium]|nr:Vitamin B12 transporter BtuB [Bacteroidia bacterium]
MKPNHFISACFLFFVATFVSYGQTGTLKGTVTNGKTKETIIGASVILQSDPKIGTITDFNGNYELKLPVGKQSIIFSFTGMQADTLTLTLKEGQVTTFSVEMNDAAQELGLTVVSAGKFEQSLGEVTVSMEVIKPNLVENKNTKSIQTALEQAPGLVILDSEPQIRGGSGFNFGVGTRVGVYVDDLPISIGDVGKPEWSFIPVENLEQIEVIKGASSVLYGSSALNGIINIRTAYPKNQPLTNVNVFTGMYSTPATKEAKWWDGIANFSGMNFFHSRKFGQLDFVFGGNALYDHNYIGPPKIETAKDSALQNYPISENDVQDRKARLNFNLRYRFKNVEGLSVGVNGNFMLSHTNFSLVWDTTGAGIYSAYPATMTVQDMFLFYVDPFITYYSPKGYRHSLRTRINHTDNDNGNNQSNRSTVFFGDYQFQRAWQSLDGLTMTAGLTGSYVDSWSQLYTAADSNGLNNSKNVAGYMQLDKKFWKEVVNMSLGVRYEFFQINQQEFVTKPVLRGGVSIRAAKETYFRTSYGQGYRFPTIAEKYIQTSAGGLGVFPNQTLKPETSWNFEMGVKQGFKIGKFFGYLDVAGFWQEYQDAMEYVFAQWKPYAGLTSNGFRFMNTADIQVRGIDISIIGRGQFTKHFGMNVLAGYTYTTPKNLDPNYVFGTDSVDTDISTPGIQGNKLTYNNTSIDTTNDVLKYRFNHIAKIDVEFFYKKFTLGYSCRYYSYMKNLDRTFYALDNTVLGTGLPQYRGDEYQPSYYDPGTGTVVPDKIIIGDNKRGNVVMDVRLSYQISPSHKIAIISNNFLNREYTLRPLKVEAPRTISLQYTLKV